MYACGAGAGLMIISKMAKIADKQAGISLGFILVAVLAIGNGAGRIIAGTMSDKIGRKATIFICFVMQAALFILLSLTVKGSILAKAPILAFVTTLIGASYGANLSLFPSVAKDYYGLKNFGMNYGFVFTAWGVGGFILPLLAGKLYDKYQTFDYAYYIASALLILAAITVFFVKPPHHRVEAND
jgi:OFA family oxalate/formate antiporter-like MFS transporter